MWSKYHTGLQSDSGIVMLRLRLGHHDAHYAGELVDGAKMLQLFGDVATELLIRLDGDEGLFRAYENIEFLKPLYAGDYVEVYGRILNVGKSSRQMEFEAYKVITATSRLNANQGKAIQVSAADALAVPELVVRARGTCVTPIPLQRKKVVLKGD